MRDLLVGLVRLGLGYAEELSWHRDIDWGKLETIAKEQGVLAIVLDGIDRLPSEQRPPQRLLLNWIGEVLQAESLASLQREVSADMAKLFYRNGIRTYILKGVIVSECYPKPAHRISVDVDCYLLPERGDFDAWSLGNELIRAKGFIVNTDFYKNSSFDLSGVLVENHQFLTPFRGNKRLTTFERVLQAQLNIDKGDDCIEGTSLCRPPVMVSALFLIEHAYSHFLQEGLTLRHVLDWALFTKKHKEKIFWSDFDAYIEEFGFRKFYDTYNRLGIYFLGEIDASSLTKRDRKMLKDIWAPLDLHDEKVKGLRRKIAFAGNTWRARWKYRYFTDTSWFVALWIQVKGFLFMKHPTLD